MENLTDDEVTMWNNNITNSLDGFNKNITKISDFCRAISNLCKSEDSSLSNSWLSLKDAIDASNDALKSKKEILNDTINTFIKSIQALSAEMVSTVNLADNEFKGYIDRINAI